jgi:uncharacterized RDD family membrane protein YckC
MVCPTCNSETMPHLFCHRCDVYMPNPYIGTRASIANRAFAHFFDPLSLAVCVVVIVLGSIFFGFLARSWWREKHVVLMSFGFFGLSCCVHAILSLRLLAGGQTVGKWLMGLRVVDKKYGYEPGLGTMLIREFPGKLASALFCGIGTFWAIWDPDGQAWHDKIAGTVVIDEQRGRIRSYQCSGVITPPSATTSLTYSYPVPAIASHSGSWLPWILCVLICGSAIGTGAWWLRSTRGGYQPILGVSPSAHIATVSEHRSRTLSKRLRPALSNSSASAPLNDAIATPVIPHNVAESTVEQDIERRTSPNSAGVGLSLRLRQKFRHMVLGNEDFAGQPVIGLAESL